MCSMFASHVFWKFERKCLWSSTLCCNHTWLKPIHSKAVPTFCYLSCLYVSSLNNNWSTIFSYTICSQFCQSEPEFDSSYIATDKAWVSFKLPIPKPKPKSSNHRGQFIAIIYRSGKYNKLPYTPPHLQPPLSCPACDPLPLTVEKGMRPVHICSQNGLFAVGPARHHQREKKIRRETSCACCRVMESISAGHQPSL